MHRITRRARLGSLWLFTLLLGLFAAPLASAATKNTTFVPATHGFNFSNSFNNDVIKDLDIRTGGLCGGMVYAALDYYNTGVAVPRQDYRPAASTPLQRYLYGRQVDSLPPNITKWAEVGINPGGARNAEFFNWGLTSELANLRALSDAGKPALLGLHGVTGITHQVLAVGYDTDAAGKLVEIRLYDPNFPNKRIQMRPNAAKQWFEYVGEAIRWRTYFVDKSYAKKAAPNIGTPSYPSDGKVRELLVEINTGEDDLRGGSDNFNVTVHLRGGGKIVRNNVNRSARWLRNYGEYASVLVPATPKADIVAVELTTSFGGGVGGDNWDTTGITVHYYTGGNVRAELVKRTSFFRFTGAARSLRMNVAGAPAAAAGEVTALSVAIGTGGDDLRGGNDNVNATIHFRDGTTQQVDNINARKKWGDNAVQTVVLTLGRTRARADIVGLTLTTTFGGGMGGDNWNVDSLEVAPVVGGDTATAYVRRTGAPLKRFTASQKSLKVTW